MPKLNDPVEGRKDTPMENDARESVKKQEKEDLQSVLEGIVREGARRMLQAAIENEVAEYIGLFKEKKDSAGHRMVVRNGFLPEREIITGIGPVAVKQPRVRDKRPGEAFTSSILGSVKYSV